MLAVAVGPTSEGCMLEEEPGARAFARNERGVIAETYGELQSLGLLDKARSARYVEKASAESLLRTVLQAAEVALYNMADLLRRARLDATAADIEACTTKFAWVRGFQRVLVRLSHVARDFSTSRSREEGATSPLRLAASPAFQDYLRALKRFDRALTRCIARGDLDVANALSAASWTDTEFSLIHLIRIGNHESEMWERNFLATAVPSWPDGYAEYVASSTLREAVFEHVLFGDTYFTQFRGLHQIPELLAAEIADTMEAAIIAIRRRDAASAASFLTWTNALTSPIEACLPAMIDNLTTHDYHEIRENLGLTSGSHSVGIRYHMFTHLYEQLWDEVALVGEKTGPTWDLLVTQLLFFRSFIFQWRDEHLHLPRNNLGGAATRSLTGSSDAVSVVEGMSDHARIGDPANAFISDRGRSGAHSPERGALASYLRTDDSLDSALLTATGFVTQSKFRNVQERTGYFANKSSFSKPPRRRV
jgi:hypothetical protein